MRLRPLRQDKIAADLGAEPVKSFTNYTIKYGHGRCWFHGGSYSHTNSDEELGCELNNVVESLSMSYPLIKDVVFSKQTRQADSMGVIASLGNMHRKACSIVIEVALFECNLNPSLDRIKRVSLL